MSQSGGFDMSKMSTASKILLGAGVLYFIDMFFQWNRACVLSFCAGVNGWHGLGLLNGVLVLVIIVMEVLLLAGVNVDIGTPTMRMQIEAGLAFGVLLFTILKVIVDNEFLSWPAWVGLILALVIGYGGWMRWQESTVSGGMSGGMGGGGMGGGGMGGGGMGGGGMGGGDTPSMP
jgi:hypothetical protein